MSARTPGLQPRSQYHSYWGQYAYTVGAGVWANGSNLMPGAPGNPIGAVEFSKLETGDIASSTDLATANRTLYVCVDVSNGDGLVEWSMLAMASTVQTIRDAHVIVVGQENYLPGALPQSPDVVGVTCDYLDVGDGVQIKAALAAALAAAVPVDIRLRPMSVTLATATLSVPNACRLIGAGQFLTTITGTDATDLLTQNIVKLAKNATLEDIQLISPPPVAQPASGDFGIVEFTGSGPRVSRCTIVLHADATQSFDRATNAAIYAAAPAGTEVIEDCDLLVDSFSQELSGAQPSYGIHFGGIAASGGSLDPQIRNVTIRPAGALSSASHGIQFDSVQGGLFENITHVLPGGTAGGLAPPTTCIGFYWGWVATTETRARLPKLRNYRVAMGVPAANDVADQTGFRIEIQNVASGLTDGAVDGMFTDCEVTFEGVAGATFERIGFLIVNASTGPVSMRNITLANCKVRFHHAGFVLSCEVNNSIIEGTKFTGCQAPNPLAGGPTTGRGAHLRANFVANNTQIRRTGFINCDFSGAPLGGAGISLDTTNVLNTLVGFNSLEPAGGSALIDTAAGTESAHNILV